MCESSSVSPSCSFDISACLIDWYLDCVVLRKDDRYEDAMVDAGEALVFANTLPGVFCRRQEEGTSGMRRCMSIVLALLGVDREADP